ncbi:hypothetical protein BH11CYA1_BH11CYA1_22640 [soil metagenome]
MKLPFSIKDKLFAALSLGLIYGVCSLSLALEPVEAKSEEAKDSKHVKGSKPVKDSKRAQDAKAKHADDTSKDGAGPKTVGSKPAEGSKPKNGKDLCPACGRG